MTDPKNNPGNSEETKDMLQTENLIDPGNEHNHLREDAISTAEGDAANDATDTKGSTPKKDGE